MKKAVLVSILFVVGFFTVSFAADELIFDIPVVVDVLTMKAHFRGKNATLPDSDNRVVTDMVVDVSNLSVPEKTANPFLEKYLQGYIMANQKELSVKVIPSEVKGFSKLVNHIGKFGQPTNPIQIKGSLDATFFSAGADQPPLIVVYLKNIEKVIIGTDKPSTGEQSCQANMRVILGAVEMYNMDHPIMLTVLNESVLGKLLAKRYLKAIPKCSKGNYASVGDLTQDGGTIRCSVHGNLK